MLKFIAKLFAAETTRTAPNKARLSLDKMEDRYAPAMLANPGATRAFNPQPEPPAEAALVRTIIAIQPGAAQGFIIEGGRN